MASSSDWTKARSGSVYDICDQEQVDGRAMILRYEPGKEYSLLRQHLA